MLNTTTIHDTGVTGGSSIKERVVIYALNAAAFNGRKVRVTVHRDSYDNQSYVRTDAWSGTQWESVVRWDATQVDLPSPYSRDVEAGFARAIDAALDVTAKVLA